MPSRADDRFTRRLLAAGLAFIAMAQSAGRTEFNVDFGAAGKVKSTGEFIRGSSH